MAEKIILPQLGTTMTEGTVHTWQKQVGDIVKKGDVLVQFETDKYTAEVESESDGVLRAIYVQEGEEVPVLTVLGIVAAENEAIEDLSVTVTEKELVQPVIEEDHKIAPIETEDSQVRIKASPLARKLAKELGVDLSQVSYSSKTGRIKQRDVMEAYEKNSVKAVEQPKTTQAIFNASQPAIEADTTATMSAMRKVIGKRMTESILTAPQVTEMCEVRVDKFLELKSKMNQNSQENKITVTDILVKMTAVALRNVPQMNASKAQDTIVLHDRINIGVAVALDDGLVVPVVMDADRKGVKAISPEIKKLVSRAREGKLSSEDMQGSTFTVSNLGGFGVEGFTPIVNLPECGILGVGRIIRKPIFNENDQIVPASMMTLSLTFDHSVVDGALAAKLLKTIVGYVEDPDRIYM